MMNTTWSHLELDQQRRYHQGDPILVEVYLAEYPDLAEDAAAVVRLLVQEFRLRQLLGESPTLTEYLTRFPDYEAVLSGLLQAEFPTPPLDPTAVPTEGFPQLEGYRVVGELGRGGMGTVYKAWHERLRCWVAIKMLHGTVGGERLRREAEAIARLRHPNIIHIHDVGEYRSTVGTVPFLVLEYVEGGSLARHLAGKPLPPREAAQLVETLARAVEYAHAAGIVHRDLKPANVLLAPGLESPKINDFGLAKDLLGEQVLTASGDVLGTPSYMAPEQVRGKGGSVGPACDLYALGAILYELLVGRPPFQAASAVETVMLVLGEEPIPPRRLQPSLPRDLEIICLKCLEKEPQRRYDSAAALADDLRRFLDHHPIQARPTSWPRRVGKWIRRNPTLAASLLVVLLAVSILTVQWYRFTVDLRQQRDRAEHHADEAQRQTHLAMENLRKARQTAEQFFLTVRDHKELRATATESLRLELLRQALNLQETLIEDYADLPQLRAEQAKSYMTLATLVTDLHSAREALPYLRKAVAIAERLVAEEPDALSHQADLAAYESTLANKLASCGELAEAEQLVRRAIEHGELVVATQTDPTWTMPRFNLANARINLGLIYRQQNRLKETEALYLRARDDAEQIVRQQPNVPDHLHLLGMVCNNLAVIYQRGQRLDPAARCYEQAIQTREALLNLSPNDPGYPRGLAVSYYNAAGLYHQLKRSADAEKAYLRSVMLLSELVRTHPTPRAYRQDLSRVQQRIGEFYRGQKRFSESAMMLEQAVATRRVLADEARRELQPALDVAESLTAWATVSRPNEVIAAQLTDGMERLRAWPSRPEAVQRLRQLEQANALLLQRLPMPRAVSGEGPSHSLR